MLQRLTIRDFVLVDRLELDFSPGFGTLTGETGAGKSILVDALAFVLGERADAGLLRAGAEKAEVGAEFVLDAQPELKAWLADNDFAADEALLLRRVLDAAGRSRAYINGSAATLQQLRQAAEWLVDIHGQHAHQSLLRAEAQRALLDAHAGLGDYRVRMEQFYQDNIAALAQLDRDWPRLRRERHSTWHNFQLPEHRRRKPVPAASRRETVPRARRQARSAHS